MANIKSILGGAFVPPAEKITAPPEQQLIDAMLEQGITPPAQVHLDGKIHRFCTNGRKGDSGWYIVFPDGVPAGRFGDWKTGVEVVFRADIGRPLTAVEEMAHTRRMAEAKALREEDERRKHEVASNTVEEIWSSGMHADANHAYLKKKGIYSHGVRVTGDGRLMVPLFNAEGKLSSLQYISEDGDKKYHPGGATSECFWTLGEDTKTIYVTEGFATGATVYEATHKHVVIAYSASNLVPVTRILREKFGAMQEIVIVADNDESGTGQKYADQASAKYGAKVIMPPVKGDANDYAIGGGNLLELLNPPIDEWLINADEFSEKPMPISWLIKGWVQEKALIMIHGPSGAGKSFLTLDMCLSMAAGLDSWNGHKTKQANVVYLAGEGHVGLRSRVAAWKQHKKIKKLKMWISKSGCNLNTPEGYRMVAEQIRALQIKPDTIIIDTLHRFLDGDENSSQDAKSMLDACAALMEEFGCTIILVHHTGVSEEAQHRARGSSAWRGALDIEISVLPSKNDMPMEIIQRKSKDAEVAEPMYCYLKKIEINGWMDEDGEPVTSAVIDWTEEPPQKEKKQTNVINERMKIFTNAWIKAGCEVDEHNRPTISRSALQAYLADNKFYNTPNSLKQAMAPSQPGKFLGSLITAEIVEVEKTTGDTIRNIVVINPTFSATLMMQKTGKFTS